MKTTSTPILHSSKKCFVKLGWTKWNSETENWRTEFSLSFKQTLAFIFNLLNIKLTNIGLSSFYDENNFQPFLTTRLQASVWMGFKLKKHAFD